MVWLRETKGIYDHAASNKHPVQEELGLARRGGCTNGNGPLFEPIKIICVHAHYFAHVIQWKERVLYQLSSKRIYQGLINSKMESTMESDTDSGKRNIK